MSTEDVLRAIDGALADEDLPDAMRWSPDPGSVTDASDCIYAEDRTAFPVIPARLPASRPRFATFPPGLEVHTEERAGEILLVIAPDEATARRLFEQMSDLARQVGESFREVATAMAGVMDSMRPALERAGLLEDPGPDRVAQPFERALWAKARQGTGPDRQVQHRPRPRRHLP